MPKEESYNSLIDYQMLKLRTSKGSGLISYTHLIYFHVLTEVIVIPPKCSAHRRNCLRERERRDWISVPGQWAVFFDSIDVIRQAGQGDVIVLIYTPAPSRVAHGKAIVNDMHEINIATDTNRPYSLEAGKGGCGGEEG